MNSPHLKQLVASAILFFLIGVGVTTIFIMINKAKAPGKDVADQEIKAESGLRNNVTCIDFSLSRLHILGSNISNLTSGVGEQPSTFPQPFGNTIICGTNVAFNTTYYLFDIEQNKLFTYYGDALKQQGFTVDAPVATDSGDAYITFQKTGAGSGKVYWYADKKAYAIAYTVVQ